MKRKKIEAKHVSIPTVSLGDIAFLLIIFFLLSSNFYKESSIKLKAPKASSLAQLQEFPVSVAIDEEGRIFLQGKRAASPDALESGVADLVKDKATTEGRTVMFKCDQAVTRDQFEPVLDAIARAGGQVAVMGEKIKEIE